MRIGIGLLICAGLSGVVSAAEGPAVVKIVRKEQGYQLLCNDQPYFAKGVCGDSRLDELVAAGGNSIRTYGGGDLDQAQRRGLTVLVGLGLRPMRQGFNYGDDKAVAQQAERIRRDVAKLKNHPALLMYALGNELELDVSQADRIKIWKALNELAKVVKQADGNHPVIAVLAGIGDTKLSEIKEHCPALDAVGINTYGGILALPAAIAKQGWTRPWLVTEFGPRGHWEVPKTPWGLPIEDSSTQKAELYLKGYSQVIAAQPACLGSYAFLWGQKQEKTHTWYGMFLPEGNRLGAVDALTMSWTGRWPANRCPEIGPKKIRVYLEGDQEAARHIFAKGQRLRCTVDASDPDGDALTVKWDLRLDVAGNRSSGGDAEPPTPPIAQAVVATEKSEAVIQLPQKEGNYRIFVYVLDPKGSAATANLPVQVK